MQNTRLLPMAAFARPRRHALSLARSLFAVPLIACAPAIATRVAPDRVALAEADAHRSVTAERTAANDSLPARTIGIPPLRVTATDTSLAPLGYGLADMLMTDLAVSSQLQIVDRLRFDALLREIKLTNAGLVDPATAPRVGRLVRARRLVLGNITQLPGRQLTIGARIADVPTATTRQAVNATARLDDFFRAERDLVYRLFTELGISLTPSERAAIEHRPTANLAAMLAYSRGVRYEVFGQFDLAAREYAAAAAIDPVFVDVNLRARDARRRVHFTAPIEIGDIGGFTLARVNSPTAYTTSRLGGGIAEASFPSQTVTLTIVITTRP